MLSIGSFNSFDASNHNWSRFASRLTQFLKANHVKKDCEVATVLTLLGEKTFDVLCDLVAPELPETKTVEQIFDVLSRHFSPKPLIRREIICFQEVKQVKQESIADFVLSLRNASLNCRFETSLESRLADQFLYGLADEAIRKRLLLEEMDVPFEKLVQLAKSMESTNKEITKSVINRDVLPEKDGADVFAMTSQELGNACFRCGSNFHDAKRCKFSKAICYNCNKVGHIAKVCQAKKSRTIQQAKSCKLLPTSCDIQEDLMRINVKHYSSVDSDLRKACRCNIVTKGILGVVRWFNPKFGYGFLTRLDNQQDIFIHANNIPKLQLSRLTHFIKHRVVVKFDIVNSRKGFKAINFSVVKTSSNSRKRNGQFGNEVDFEDFKYSKLNGVDKPCGIYDVTLSQEEKDEWTKASSEDLCSPYFSEASMFP